MKTLCKEKTYVRPGNSQGRVLSQALHPLNSDFLLTHVYVP